MSNRSYTEDERAEFTEHAVNYGIPTAMEMLGYPGSWNTGKKWCDQAGVEVRLDELAKHAKSYDVFYTNKEKVLAAQTLLSTIYESLRKQRTSLGPKDLRELANAMQTVMQTLALVEGGPTNRTESWSRDGTDVELQQMLSEARAKNDQSMQE